MTWLGQIPKFFQKFDLKAPLKGVLKIQNQSVLSLSNLSQYIVMWGLVGVKPGAGSVCFANFHPVVIEHHFVTQFNKAK